MIRKLLLSFVMMLLGLSLQAQAGEIKFAQITDNHFSVKSDYSANVLKSAINDINSQGNISFVVFTGDNIDSSKEENLRAFLKIVKRLNIPYYIVIGNHDVFKSNGISKKKYMDIVKQNNWFRASIMTATL